MRKSKVDYLLTDKSLITEDEQ